MRDFAKAHKQAQWLADLHQRPYWVIPKKNGYEISVFRTDDVPEGTQPLKVNPTSQK